MRRFFSISLLAVGFIAAWFAIGLVIWQHRAITTFIPVPAKMISSTLGIHRGNKGGVSYSPEVAYSYTYGGRLYTSRRVLPFSEQGSRTWASRVISAYRQGRQVTAYIDPRNPEEAILWRVHSLMPYLFSIGALLMSLVGLFLLLGFLGGGRKTMLAVPLDGEGRHLLMPVLELRKQRRDWGLMWLGYTLVTGVLWGHYLVAGEERDTATWIFTAVLGAGWLVLAIKAWRVWSTSRHVSDARVIVRPTPMKRGETLEIRAELDAYHALRVKAMHAAVVCTKHYREQRGSKTVYGTYKCAERDVQLCSETAVAAGEVLAGEGHVIFDTTTPVSWDGGKKIYPYHTWELRLTVDLTGMVNYHGTFPLLVE